MNPFNSNFKSFEKEALQKNGELIKYIKDPSEKMQLIAVKNYLPAIKSIKNPCKEVVDYAIDCAIDTVKTKADH